MILLAACNSSDTKENKSDSTSTTSSSSEVKKEEAWVPVDSATMMKAMMDYGTLGKMHEMMASWNGTWANETTMWDYDGAAPKKSAATSVNTMRTLGYDNASKQFVNTWIDSWSSGIMTMTGPWNESAKNITLNGTMPDICRPGKECSFRQIITIVDGNTQMMEMHGPDPKTGKEYKMMEIKSTRKK